jgi:hypothetical protein
MVLMAVLVVPQEGPVSTEIRQPVRVNTERACRETAAKNTLQREEIRNGYKVVISIKAQCIYDPEDAASDPARYPVEEPVLVPPREVGPEPEDRERYASRRYVPKSPPQEAVPEPEDRKWYDPRRYVPFLRH